MKRQISDLINYYSELQKKYNVLDTRDKYMSLVTASTNQTYPVQRWFHLKEAFSLDLLETLLLDWKVDPNSLNNCLDPFSGTGTTLLSLQKIAKKYGNRKIHAFGFERNPFLQFVAETKINWHKFDKEIVKAKTAYLLNGAYKPVPPKLPELSTLNKSEVYDRKTLNEILGFKSAISMLDEQERALLLLGYANALEDLSGVRKDGRALRLVANKKKPLVPQAFKLSWTSIIEDLELAKNIYEPIQGEILCGDGRLLKPDSEEIDFTIQNMDLILYSPPYLNNIDYTEVYKIELWLCGFVTTKEEFRNLRYKTFRSHPSVKFQSPNLLYDNRKYQNINNTLDILIETLPIDDDINWRKRLFLNYFDDMYQSLCSQKEALQEGGWIFCVVGNSLHGSSKQKDQRIPVASDVIIASIAEAIGLEVKAIQVARKLKRRSPDSEFLRESIVVMRKP